MTNTHADLLARIESHLRSMAPHIRERKTAQLLEEAYAALKKDREVVDPGEQSEYVATLHLYAQEIWHDEAYVVGTREALVALRTEIDRALAQGRGHLLAYTNDGEGYTAHVMLMGPVEIARLCVPYTDECAKAPESERQFGPWALTSPADNAVS